MSTDKESYTLLDKLICDIIPINFKLVSNLEFSHEDKIKYEMILKCARLYKQLTEEQECLQININEEDLLFEIPLTDNNVFSTSNKHDELVKNIDKKNEETIKNELTKIKAEEQQNVCKDIVVVDKDEPIDVTYENDVELLKIFNDSFALFEQHTQNELIALNDINESFWSVVDVK